LKEGADGSLGGLGIVDGEVSQIVAGIWSEMLLKIMGKGPEIGAKTETVRTRSSGQLDDLAIWVMFQPRVKLGAVFGRKAGKFGLLATFSGMGF
jgi:hypothetical protein